MVVTRRRFIELLIVLAAGIALAVYALFDPTQWGFFPRCMFKSLTGLDCPGCGSQRAIHALLHGDIGAAWGFNPLLLLSLPVLLLLAMPDRVEAAKRLKRSVWLPRILLVVVTVWWVVRNLV